MAESTITNQFNGYWLSESISCTTSGMIYLYVNKSLKLAIVTYNSQTDASEGRFTLPDWVIPAATIYAGLRGNGYLSVSSGSTQGLIVNSGAYMVGQIIFPIR